MLIQSVGLENSPVIFDVGCTICHPEHTDFTGECLDLFNDCKIFGFEPTKWHSYEEKYKDDNRVTLIKEVLSDVSGSVPFYTFVGNTGISSLFNREVFSTCDDLVETVVDCNTLDGLCATLNIDKIDYLKIDAEGAEYKILIGAERMLRERKIINVQFEFHESCSVVDAGFSFLELEEWLNEFGLFFRERKGDDYLFTMKGNDNE